MKWQKEKKTMRNSGKALLTEATVKRFMKLASLQPIGRGVRQEGLGSMVGAGVESVLGDRDDDLDVEGEGLDVEGEGLDAEGEDLEGLGEEPEADADKEVTISTSKAECLLDFAEELRSALEGGEARRRFSS